MFTLLLALSAPASAQDALEYWTYDDYRDGASMVGRDGWEGGYSSDLWYGGEQDGEPVVYPSTDHSVDDAGGDWGEGGAIDNWLVNDRVDAEDVVVRARLYTEDYDSMGIICRFQDNQNYYLFVMTGGGGSSPIDAGANVSSVVKVSGGEATVLNAESGAFTGNTWTGLQLTCDDNGVEAALWEELDEDWEDPDLVISAVDSDAFGAGAAGFYGYDCGGDGVDATQTFFGAIDVLRVDEDEDGVADDSDNCEEVSNADQADGDDDGVGTACDDDEGGDDTGSSGGSSGGSGSGGSGSGGSGSGGSGSGGSGGSSGGFEETPDLEPTPGKLSSCACASGPQTGAPWAALALALGLVVRRRRS